MAGTRGKHLLAVYAGIPGDIEDDFNRWYNTQHIPERLAIPGFQRAARYEALKGEPKYLALYELEDASVLESPAYTRLAKQPNDWDKRIMPKLQVEARTVYECIFTCGEAAEAHAPFLLSVRLDIAPEVENDFNEWYNVDHLPKLAAVPGVHGARRYRKLSGNGTKYLALYEFANEQVTSTEAWSKAANTEWTKKMRPHLKPLTQLGKRIF
jgi:hypothetical protein